VCFVPHRLRTSAAGRGDVLPGVEGARRAAGGGAHRRIHANHGVGEVGYAAQCFSRSSPPHIVLRRVVISYANHGVEQWVTQSVTTNQLIHSCCVVSSSPQISQLPLSLTRKRKSYSLNTTAQCTHTQISRYCLLSQQHSGLDTMERTLIYRYVRNSAEDGTLTGGVTSTRVSLPAIVSPTPLSVPFDAALPPPPPTYAPLHVVW
jgi:hypothetical protein